MALIQCSECGNRISTQAAACPQCGYSCRPARVRVGRLGAKFEAIGALTVLGSIFVVPFVAPPSLNIALAVVGFMVGLIVFVVGRFL